MTYCASLMPADPRFPLCGCWRRLVASDFSHPVPTSPRRSEAAVRAARSLLHVIAISRKRIDDGDLLDREVRHDLDVVLLDDQHLLDPHAVMEALAVLGLEREGHALLDLDRMIERPDARYHRRVVLRQAEAVPPQIGGGL